jgi:hypothetical protein
MSTTDDSKTTHQKSQFESPEAIAEEEVAIQSDIQALKGTVVRNSSKPGGSTSENNDSSKRSFQTTQIEFNQKVDPTKVANGIVMEINNCAG